jgi:GNAT superfamily N-acetyltransferase
VGAHEPSAIERNSKKPAQSVQLAQNGKALLPIVVASKAGPQTRQAAKELGEFLNRITGATFSTQTPDGKEVDYATPARKMGIAERQQVEAAAAAAAKAAPPEALPQSGILVGTKEEFLATLGMRFTLAPAAEEDLRRAEELTQRTNQLNTTGYTYSYEELDAFRLSDEHLLLVASLEDKYGSYGKIGLALAECGREAWEVKLLLMSCRVMSRGVGMIMINHVMSRAKRAGARLRAGFLPNGRNRMMYVTYKFAGFKEVEKRGDLSVLEHDLAHVPPFPGYVEVKICD